MKEIIGNRRIILWGTGNTGNDFYKNIKDRVPIYACTSNEKEIIPIKGLLTMQHNCIDKENYFIVICSIYYEEIRTQLMLEGWEVNRDFIRYNLFEKMYFNKKKLIVAVGQCEIQEMTMVLNRLEKFREDYTVIYYNERKVCRGADLFNYEESTECMNVLRFSNYLIKPSSISPNAVMYFAYLQKFMNVDCKVITISLFHFDSYWPNDISKERGKNRYYMTIDGKKLCAYVERDQVIERFVDEGMDVNQIMDKITDTDFLNNDEVKKNHENTLKRMRISDRLSDIKISDYVRTHYNTNKLFCDRGHFNVCLLKEYVIRILKYFGVSYIDEVENMDIDDMFRCLNELPIYPSTARILNLEWVNKDTLYRQQRYDGVKMVTFEEYMESFIRYCYSAKKLAKYCYHDC